MKKLLKGIIDFRKQSLPDYRARFSNLVYGQSPDTLFIACCDSRVVPNVFASTDPGDLFVLRNIGNLVPPYGGDREPNSSDISVGAAIEFSIRNLKVKDIVICGHSECGAMCALQEAHGKDEPFINQWLTYAAPALASYEESKYKVAFKPGLSNHNQLAQINVLEQLEHLKTYPLVAEKLREGKVKLHGWWFDLATADVNYYDLNRGKFVLIDEDEATKLLDSL